LNGKPLIYYTIKEALKSKFIDSLICSTEDDEIARIAESHGAKIPFMRPKEFATDTALTIDSMKHALSFFDKKGEKYDILVLLQPTTPFRIVEDIDESIKKLIENNADSVISVVDVVGNHPFRMSKIEEGQMTDFIKEPVDGLPKQLLPKLYIRNGAIYAMKRETIMKLNSLKGNKCLAYIMPEERSLNMDSILDLKFADFLMKQNENEKH